VLAARAFTPIDVLRAGIAYAVAQHDQGRSAGIRRIEEAPMASANLERLIDGDGHVMEDIEGIISHLPEPYRAGGSIRDPFPASDHLHSSNKHTLPEGAFARVGVDGWLDFMKDLAMDKAVLYTTRGLTFGKIVSKDWAIELARAYNDWIYETYVKGQERFQVMGLIPLQEPAEAVLELRRIVEELGFIGAMLPSTGADGLQSHLGNERYWPIYAEAERLGCAIGIHGGAHDNMLMDDMSPYAPVNALGHPYGQMVNFAGIIFNGVFDKYPGVKIGFMEAGCGWLLTCMERFTSAWATHVQYDPRGRFLQIRKHETVADYINRHIDEGRIYVGIEGDELTLPYALHMTGPKPYIFSSDFPHEVNNETCKAEIEELRENPEVSSEAKEAILSGNATRFYGFE
jgi:predicted TIM-barrel fold metal-dependent hydrolase